MKNFFKTFMASILSILLFFVLFGSVILFQVEHNLSTKQIVKVVKQIDVKEILDSTELKEEGDSFVDDIYQEASTLGISKDTVDAFLNSETVKETVGIIVGNITESTLTGKVKEMISVDELNSLLDQAMEEVSQNENITISNEQKEQFLNEAKSYSSEIVKELPTTESLQQEILTDELKTVQYVFSDQVKVMMIGSVLLLIGLIVLLKWKDKSFLLYLGTPTIILSILLLIVSFLIPVISNLITDSSTATKVIELAVQNIKDSVLISGIVGFIFSIACFVCYGVKFKKEEKEVTNPANL